MDNRNTRTAKRKALEKGDRVRGALKRAREVIESVEGEERELELPQELATNSLTMGEAGEAIREMGRVMMETLTAQLEAQREFQREREETNSERFRELIEGQNRQHREDAETLASEFERMRIEKEQARSRINQKLPNYDGINLEVDEWQDKGEAVMTCNAWDIQKLLDVLPTYLTAQAKRAYDSVKDDDKRTKELFFQSMRVKIDPQSERKNKEMFLVARKGPNENVMSYIDRCRMYIRRSGGDPHEAFAQEMLRYKVYESLTTTDKKILNATIGPDESLESIILKADAMLGTQPAVIGGVMGQEPGQQRSEREQGWNEANVYRGNGARGTGMNNGLEQQRQPRICYRCNRPGHIRRYCQTPLEGPYGNEYRGQEQNQNQFIRQPVPHTRAPNPRGNGAGWRPMNIRGGVRAPMLGQRTPLQVIHEDFPVREQAQAEQVHDRRPQVNGNQGRPQQTMPQPQGPLNSQAPL